MRKIIRRMTAQRKIATERDAMSFMRERDWISAARQFRHQSTHSNGAMAMQYGHALKELGLLTLAEEQYKIAAQHAGDDLDGYMQLGHLYKVSGNFQRAIAYYAKAMEIAKHSSNHEAIQEIKSWLTPLYRLTNGSAHDNDVDFYISSAALGLLGSTNNPESSDLGRENYSYAYAAKGIVAALDNAGYCLAKTENPEYFPAPSEYERAKIHISFSPPHLARVIKGAYNIIHFAWEFSRIPSAEENTSPHPFQNWIKMLSAFDEIWVPSNYAVSAISKFTDRPIYWVPSPIAEPRRKPQRWKPGSALAQAKYLRDIRWVPLSIFPRLQPNFSNHAIDRERTTSEIIYQVGESPIPKIYLTILNPHDKRKQLAPLLMAFSEFSRIHADAVLLIKTSSPDDSNRTINERIFSHQLAEVTDLVPPHVSDQIWIFNGALSVEQMNALYAMASFFVCTSYAEGQNLPLLEAMAAGCVPISVDHTAMSDYISDENSITIASQVVPANASMRRIYGMYSDFGVNSVSIENVLLALQKSSELTEAQYREKAENSLGKVRDVYGAKSLLKRIAEGELCKGRVHFPPAPEF